MKKKSIVITLILALLMMVFSATAVLAEGDDHGADAHSEQMSQMEEDVMEEEEPDFVQSAVNFITSYLPYVVAVIGAVLVLVVIVKIISRSRKPKYTGRH